MSGPNPLDGRGYASVDPTVQITAVLLSNCYARIFDRRRANPDVSACREVASTAGITLPDTSGDVCWHATRRLVPPKTPPALVSSPRRSTPLSELRLDDVVDINSNAADPALVDLDLVQVGGRMSETFRGAPAVLPEVGAQAVLQRPVDGFG